jgi:heat shock protein HslJ
MRLLTHINRRYSRQLALHLLLAFALSVLSLTAPAQAQGTPMDDLLGTEWLLEDLGGSGVIDNARATLAFPERGKVTGNGSCNRFFGSVEFTGDLVSFGNMGATRMQCADAVSDQEQRYLAALQAAYRMSSDGAFLFVHSKSFEKPLRFTKLEKP